MGIAADPWRDRLSDDANAHADTQAVPHIRPPTGVFRRQVCTKNLRLGPRAGLGRRIQGADARMSRSNGAAPGSQNPSASAERERHSSNLRQGALHNNGLEGCAGLRLGQQDSVYLGLVASSDAHYALFLDPFFTFMAGFACHAERGTRESWRDRDTAFCGTAGIQNRLIPIIWHEL